MYALLVTTLVLAQAPTPAPAERPDKAPTAKPGAAQSLDGNWTVICYEKNGQPMAEAKDCQVTVKDNIVTFAPKDEKNKMMAIRIEFTQPGMLRATEVENAGTAPDKAGEAKQGVYVMTQDYLAVCLHDAKGKTGDKEQPGKEQPVSKDKDQPAPTDGKPGANAGPNGQSYCTVILKRSGTTERK